MFYLNHAVNDIPVKTCKAGIDSSIDARVERIQKRIERALRRCFVEGITVGQLKDRTIRIIEHACRLGWI